MRRLVLFLGLLLFFLSFSVYKNVYAAELVCPATFQEPINPNTGSLRKDIDVICPGVMKGRGIRSYNDINGSLKPDKECCRNFGKSGPGITSANSPIAIDSKQDIVVVRKRVERGHENDWQQKVCKYSSVAGYSDNPSACPAKTDVTNSCCKYYGTNILIMGGGSYWNPIYSVVGKVDPSQQTSGLCCPTGWSDNVSNCKWGNSVSYNGKKISINDATYHENYCCQMVDIGKYYDPQPKQSCSNTGQSTAKECCPSEGAPWGDSNYDCGPNDGTKNCCHNKGSKNYDTVPKEVCGPGTVKPSHSDKSTVNNPENNNAQLSLQLSENKGTVFCDGNENNALKEPASPDNVRVYTAFGCVPATVETFIKWLLPYLFGIAGGISFLLMVFGFIKIATSAGDPKEIEGAKETITSAIIGLVVSIFALFILKLILADILKIPGIS